MEKNDKKWLSTWIVGTGIMIGAVMAYFTYGVLPLRYCLGFSIAIGIISSLVLCGVIAIAAAWENFIK